MYTLAQTIWLYYRFSWTRQKWASGKRCQWFLPHSRHLLERASQCWSPGLLSMRTFEQETFVMCFTSMSRKLNIRFFIWFQYMNSLHSTWKPILSSAQLDSEIKINFATHLKFISWIEFERGDWNLFDDPEESSFRWALHRATGNHSLSSLYENCSIPSGFWKWNRECSLLNSFTVEMRPDCSCRGSAWTVRSAGRTGLSGRKPIQDKEINIQNNSLFSLAICKYIIFMKKLQNMFVGFAVNLHFLN